MLQGTQVGIFPRDEKSPLPCLRVLREIAQLLDTRVQILVCDETDINVLGSNRQRIEKERQYKRNADEDAQPGTRNSAQCTCR
jgi:hypothetical protein